MSDEHKHEIDWYTCPKCYQQGYAPGFDDGRQATLREVKKMVEKLKPFADIEIRDGKWMIETEEVIAILDTLSTKGE